LEVGLRVEGSTIGPSLRRLDKEVEYFPGYTIIVKNFAKAMSARQHKIDSLNLHIRKEIG
jgi:hypothetical protein